MRVPRLRASPRHGGAWKVFFLFTRFSLISDVYRDSMIFRIP